MQPAPESSNVSYIRFSRDDKLASGYFAAAEDELLAELTDAIADNPAPSTRATALVSYSRLSRANVFNIDCDAWSLWDFQDVCEPEHFKETSEENTEVWLDDLEYAEGLYVFEGEFHVLTSSSTGWDGTEYDSEEWFEGKLRPFTEADIPLLQLNKGEDDAL